MLTTKTVGDEGEERALAHLLRAGLQMNDYAVSAAISMAAVGLSPGAQMLDS